MSQGKKKEEKKKEDKEKPDDSLDPKPEKQSPNLRYVWVVMYHAFSGCCIIKCAGFVRECTEPASVFGLREKFLWFLGSF